MVVLENNKVGDFIRAATVIRPGVATSVQRLRLAFEKVNGKVNRSVWLAELGRAGVRLVEIDGVALAVDIALPEPAAA